MHIYLFYCKRKSNHNLEFRYGNFVIDIVDSYVYLGVNFNYNGKFKVALETISNQATRAIYGLEKHTNMTLWILRQSYDFLIRLLLQFFYMEVKYGVLKM